MTKTIEYVLIVVAFYNETPASQTLSVNLISLRWYQNPQRYFLPKMQYAFQPGDQNNAQGQRESSWASTSLLSSKVTRGSSNTPNPSSVESRHETHGAMFKLGLNIPIKTPCRGHWPGTLGTQQQDCLHISELTVQRVSSVLVTQYPPNQEVDCGLQRTSSCSWCSRSVISMHGASSVAPLLGVIDMLLPFGRVLPLFCKTSGTTNVECGLFSTGVVSGGSSLHYSLWGSHCRLTVNQGMAPAYLVNTLCPVPCLSLLLQGEGCLQCSLCRKGFKPEMMVDRVPSCQTTQKMTDSLTPSG